jgi:hypothetical protein
MTTLLKNIKELEIFLNAEIAQKQFRTEKKQAYKIASENRSKLENLSLALKKDLESEEVFEEVKAELKSTELKEAPQTGTIFNMNILMEKFNELLGAFKTKKPWAKTFIEEQKNKVQFAYEDLVEKLCEHFKVKGIGQVKVDKF